MPKDCLLPQSAERLKKAFRSGALSMNALFNAKSSEARVEMLRKYVGETAQTTNATLEKAFLSPNQKLAMQNWVFKNIAQSKPLYKDLTLDQSEAMAKGIDVKELRNMTTDERIAEFSKYVSSEMAQDLNSKFERLLKSGNLPNWEERTLGTERLRTDKRLKGSLARLEALDDLGVLNPTELEDFMQSFVESELGVDVTMEESQKLSDLINEQRDAYDKIVKKDDWTADNSEQVEDYFDKRKALEDYTDSLKDVGVSDIANNVFDYMRASILASPRILRNSFLYQMVPGIERAITKRIVSGAFNDADLQSDIVEKMRAKISAIKPDDKSVDFIKRQVAMAVRIYHKTGYDISRMQTLEDGHRYFGEDVGQIQEKSFKDAKGIKEKTAAVATKIAKIVNLAPKWFAGGTDMLFANIGRADTSIMMAKEIASIEKMRGKLPKGMTEQDRAYDLLRESYSFDPQDKRAQTIREAGILDAHMMNNTQPDGWADKVLQFRRGLKIGRVNFGKAIIPFAKIVNVVISEGVKTASGYGIGKSIYDINRASQKSNEATRANDMRKAVSNLVRYVGLTGAALLLTGLLDDDDYVGSWDTINRKSYDLARASGAGTNYVRIGGKWVPLRYLPMINIPISAIMTARQAANRKDDPIAGYLVGMVGQIMDAPGIKESRDIFQKVGWALKSNNLKKMAKTMGFDYDGLSDWAKVRMIPSVLSYDVYNAVFKPEAKYDFMGREIQKGGMFRDDKTNDIILEINRLDKVGKAPAISDPSGDYAKELEAELGEEEYAKVLAQYQRVYAEKVSEKISSSFYKNLSDDQKMKTINKIREKQILNKLKKHKTTPTM